MSGEPVSPVKQALLTISRLRAEVARLSAPEPVAIIGMACRLPGADSPEAVWERLRRGDDAVGEAPPGRWDEAALDALEEEGRAAARHGAFLAGADLFDADFFGIAAREAHAMDPQQRLLLELAWEAIERANLDPAALHGSPTGVFVGLGTFDYAQAQAAAGVDPGRHYVSGTAMSVAAGRVSYTLGLAGPSLVVDTACSSSLVALHQACLSLRARECRMALAGGAGLMFSPLPSIAFARARMLSPRGRCRTFDASADGYVRGEGGGIVVLKRLSDAAADGDRILAVIRGSAVNQDGASGGLTVPSGPAQEAVMRAAWAQAGAMPEDLLYLEAHGTGTPLGDPIELRSVARVYGEGRAAPLQVGSLKTNFGHLEAAAGIAGVIKAVLCLRHAEAPPHLHLHEPNPHFAWEGSGIAVPSAPTPLPARGRRLAAVNAFGFSGTNAHVVLEAPEDAPSGAARAGTAVLALSARSAAALRELAARHAAALRGLDPARWADWCATAALCRAALPHRLALVADAPGEAAGLLAAFAAEGAATGVLAGSAAPGAPPPADASPGAAAKAFVAGATPDWTRVFGAAPTRRLDLPTMPWQRERFWFGMGDAPCRPLLLAPLRLAASDAAVFAGRPGALGPLTPDHVVFGRPVVAGATWLAASLEAAMAEGLAELSDIRLPQALAAEAPEFQVTVEADGAVAVAARDAGEAWRTCLSARAGRGASHSPPALPPDTLRARCAGTTTPAELYAAAARHGIALGPRFRWLAEIRTGEGEALGRCTPPPGVAAEEAGRLHPGLLDAGFQLLLAASGAEYARTMVPTRLARVRLHAWPGEAPVWCHLRLTGRDEGSLTADLVFLDGAGRAFLEAEGLEARATGEAALLGGAARAPDEWFLGTEWRDRRLRRPALAPVAAGVAEPVRAEGLAAYAAALRALDGVALAWMARAAGALGWRAGDAGIPTAVAPRHRRLLARLLPRLGLAEPSEPDAATEALLREHPAVAAEAGLVARCGPALPAILRGEAEALPLLFPAGDAGALGRTYAEAFATRAANAALRDALRGWTAAAGPFPVSVLEVGAGTGATTAAVLDALPHAGLRYAFTDVAASLIARARERFPGVEPRVLDIERDPEEQGFTPQAQDLVVAANVLHATRNLPASLAHVRRLLAPGGALVLVEATAPHAWLDVTFGLTEGWWRFADERAAAGHPLLDVAGWTRLLNAAGFDEVRVLPGTAALGQAVLLARAAPGPEAWLLAEDGCAEAAAALARLIAAEGGTCRVLAAPLAAVEGAPTRIVHLCGGTGDPAAHAAHAIATLRAGSAAEVPPVVTLVSFGALDAAPGDRVDGLGAAGLAGVAKVAALEMPALRPRLLDATPDDPHGLLAALREPGEVPVSALRGGTLRVPRLVRAAVPTGAPGLAPGCWQVITGGLGGIGQALAGFLVARGARRVALLARRKPDEAARRRIAEWTASGAEIRCLSCDVADPEAVDRAIAALAAEAPLEGVFHAAGTLQDGLLAATAVAAVAPSFRAKVGGAWNLHRATLAHAPARFVLFSSAAALLGSAGQAAHAAANAWLDSFAAHRRARGLPALSVAWGAWAQVGAAARLGRDEAFRRAGHGTIAPEAGLDALARLMAADASGRGVVPLDLPRFLAGRPAWPLFEEILPREDAAAAAAGAGAEETVLAELAQVLGLRRRPDADRPFLELGLDSLATLELRNRLQARFARPIPAAALLDHPTARRLATWLDRAEVLPADLSANLSPTGPAPEPEDLEALSEAELDALIGGLLQSEGTAP
jgi:acyl transferase domain-containing protein/NAD(P)-dependent dehydrogenase (short-subunit alcohol dehydrogenase family)/acyl carrier protein